MNKNIVNVGASRTQKVVAILGTGLALAGSAMAQTGSGNSGADTIIAKVEGLAPVAIAVIVASVAVAVLPWGAKMAIRAFKSIGAA